MTKDLLNCKDLYNPIEGDNAKPSDVSNVDWKKLKKKTLGALVGGHQSLQSCCQRNKSPHFLEELGKHV